MLVKSLSERKMKTARALLLANASALALAACGGSDTPAPEEPLPPVDPNAPNYVPGTDEAESLAGSMGDDLIEGFGGGDFVLALDGNDEVSGGAGDDIIRADSGNDIIYGGPGNDTIYPGDGDDKAYGGDGDDIIYLSPGNDLEDGGLGNDTIKLDSSHSGVATTIDLLIGQYYFTAQGSSAFLNLKSIENVESIANADLTILDTPSVNSITTGEGDDVIKSVGGNDIISTGGGNDRVELATGFIYDVKLGSGNDEVVLGLTYSTIDGGTGTDALTVNSLNGISEFYADLGAGFYFFKGVATSQDGFDTLLSGFETVTVTGQVNVELIGAIGAETFTTDAGADTVSAGGGDDIISLGQNADTVTGGVGNDTIDLGAADLSADTVIFSVAASNGSDTIKSFETGMDKLNFTAIDTLVGTLDLSATSAASKVALSSAKVLIVGDTTALNWSDVAAKMTAGIDMTGVAAGDTLIAVNNGTDSRVYLYQDDANDDTAIEDAELTLLATLEATILAEGDFVVA